MIELDNIHKNFGQTSVLKGIDASIHRGDFITISGASGAGKSTLLHLIAGLDSCSSGQVRFEGKPLDTLGKKERNQWRNERVGLVFQFHNLLAELNALDNTMVPRWIGKSNNHDTARAEEILNQLGVGHRLDHYPNQLSGGEKQRVAIARALVNEPSVIFADEPTGNLDHSIGAEVMMLLETLCQAGTTLIVVTHDRELSARAKRHIGMRDGKIVTDTP